VTLLYPVPNTAPWDQGERTDDRPENVPPDALKSDRRGMSSARNRAQRDRDARAARPHLVKSARFGERRRVVCRCGAKFTGETRQAHGGVGYPGASLAGSDEAMAAAYHQHVWHCKRRVAPVETVTP
jgi:hypothetical protein